MTTPKEQALNVLDDALQNLDGFVQTFEPEDWGYPDRFGERFWEEIDAALQVLRGVTG